MSKSWSTCTLLCLNSKNAAQKVCHTQASYQTTKLILVQNYPRQLKYQRNIHYIFNSAATSCKENKFFNDIVKVKAYQYNLLNNFSTLNKAYSKVSAPCVDWWPTAHHFAPLRCIITPYTNHLHLFNILSLYLQFLSLTGRNWRRPTTTRKVAWFKSMYLSLY